MSAERRLALGRAKYRNLLVSMTMATFLALPVGAAGAGQLGALGSASGVTRIEITRREPLADGVSFGNVGPYEKLVGTAFLEADPADPHNSVIVDLDKAPRNARGMVEYSTDLYLIKPIDISKGNGKLFFQANNRGNKGTLSTFNDAPGSNDPSSAAELGNGFLLREGYALVWAGWEGELLPGVDRMTIKLPTATDGGAVITGPTTVRFDVARQIPEKGAASLPLSGRPEMASNETASLDTATPTLTVRDYLTTPERTISSDRWAFATCDRNQQTGAVENLVQSNTDICLFDGFDPNQLYQLSYIARNPKPMALGYAVTRDILSFLRYDATDTAGTLNPLGKGIANVYCWGQSQTGQYMRSYLYLGFNEDTAGRKVCDGAIVQISGAQRQDLNTRFPSPDAAGPWGALGLYPRAEFPFTYGTTTDPVTGSADGILKRPGTDPLLIDAETENEYWQSFASLVTHDANGVPHVLPDSVRYYFLSSAQHAAGVPSTKGICDQPSNPLNYNPFLRAALVNLDRWVSVGAPPPPSRYPRADDGTLVSADEQRSVFPAIPGVQVGTPNSLTARDFGPLVKPTGGIPTIRPGNVVAGATYTVLVPQPDVDGNDVAGLRRPDDIQTPIGTHTGWNVRAPGFRGGDLCALNGMFIPFARTLEERLDTQDPRPSLAERYPTHADYVDRVAKAALELKSEGYLLSEDEERIVKQAEARPLP